MAEPMWQHQRSLDPVLLDLTFDARQLGEMAAALRRAGSETAKKLTEEVIWPFGRRVYAGAYQNLSGTVLDVQTGRLRGSLTKAEHHLEIMIESDVFYGALWESQYADASRCRPWLAPALEAEGGEAGFDRELTEWLEQHAGEALGE